VWIRCERTLAALNRERLSQSLALRRLPEAGVAEMVAALLAEASPPLAFIAALHHETEGNPFFIEEVLKHLVEEGAISPAEGRWQIRPLEEFSVPPSVKTTIGRRLERLPKESRETLTLAAVMGQQFDFEVLLQAQRAGDESRITSQETSDSSLPSERLLAILDEWLAAHLVVEERPRAASVGEQYHFQHALIREVLYDELSLPRKARLHERVGLALEAASAGALEEPLDELAYHFARACGGSAMEKGVTYCLRAGERAFNLYANEAAVQHLTVALELLDRLPADELHLRRRWEVALLLARAYWATRVFERGQEVLRDYLALAERAGYGWGVAAAHYALARGLGVAHWAAGLTGLESSRRRQREHLEKSLQIAEVQGVTEWQARARERLAWFLCNSREELPRAEALLRRTLQAPDGVPREVVHDTYRWLMWVCALQQKWDEVTAALRQCLPYRYPSVVNWCLGAMEEALHRAGKQAEFIAFCEKAKALCAQAGLPLALNQWYLQPVAPSEEFRQLLFRDDFAAPELRPEWQWHDPAQVSTYSLSERPNHLTLRPGSGVDLGPDNNLNAPRMLLEARGDFALETKIVGHREKRSSGLSGLLVWMSVLNFLRLDRWPLDLQGGHIRLEARVAGDQALFGRGQLWGDSYYLRLERTGERFAALCSTDGVQWLTCGYVDLPVKDPLWVGVWGG
jgi:hypothetical protein